MYGTIWWISAVSYFIAAALFFYNSRTLSSRGPWLKLSVFTAILGSNKLLNFTGILLRQLRQTARREGWYADRAPIQRLFIISVALVAVIAIVTVFVRLGKRKWSTAQRLSLMGVLYLLAYSLTRSSSLHRIDSFLYRPIMGIKLNWVFELSGVGLLIFAAIWGRHRQVSKSVDKGD